MAKQIVAKTTRTTPVVPQSEPITFTGTFEELQALEAGFQDMVDLMNEAIAQGERAMGLLENLKEIAAAGEEAKTERAHWLEMMDWLQASKSKVVN